MDNSSTNPYIPQESEAIRNKVYQRQSPFGKIVKIAFIVTGVVSILVGIGLFFVIPMTSKDDKDARMALANVLQPTDQISKDVPVASELGFSLRYDNQRFTGEARVQGPEQTTATKTLGASYDNNDLRTKRDYEYVAITPVESTDSSRSMVTLPPQLQVSTETTIDALKKMMEKPEYADLSQLNAFVKMQTDLRMAKKVADDKTVVTIEDSKPTAQTINDVQYQKVRYITKNDNYRISNELYEDCYYTIQNERPYAACITGVRPNNLKAAALVEQVLQTISYQKTTTSKAEESKKSDAVSRINSPVTLAQATDTDTKKSDIESDKNSTKDDVKQPQSDEESPLIAKKAEYNDNAASLRSIAITQPSVVRIGTIYCADIALKTADGATAAQLTDACAGNVNSGVIVSSDGYVATTGHAVRYSTKEAINGYINFAESRTEMFDRLQRVLDYLVKAKIINQSDAEYMKNGAGTGDQEALAKIENITSMIPDNFVSATKEEYSYSIQPSDKPIVINRTAASKPSFAYSDTVISAKFVVANYDSSKSKRTTFSGDNSANDTGLLKMEGSFQNVAVGSSDEVKSNANLNTVGFPAYTDSGLTVDKVRNMPVVTQSTVQQVYKDKLLIQTNAPVVPGNDGAPTVNQAGSLVGFATYGSLYCPDQLCFASGTVRSTSELLAMLNKENISLGSQSEATKTWTQAIDEYFKGNYQAASAHFASAGDQYGYNVNAAVLQKLAVSKQGTQGDTSLANQGVSAMIWSLVVLVILTILLVIVYIVHRKRIDSLQVGHYGIQTPVSPASSTPYAQPLAPTAPQGVSNLGQWQDQGVQSNTPQSYVPPTPSYQQPQADSSWLQQTNHQSLPAQEQPMQNPAYATPVQQSPQSVQPLNPNLPLTPPAPVQQSNVPPQAPPTAPQVPSEDPFYR